MSKWDGISRETLIEMLEEHEANHVEYERLIGPKTYSEVAEELAESRTRAALDAIDANQRHAAMRSHEIFVD